MADINFGEISEALNEKLDRDTNNIQSPKLPIFLIDVQYPTASNNYRWYRLYSDGWIEQGGYQEVADDANVTVTLTKPMADTNYSVLFGNRSSTYTASTFASPTCIGKSTTTINIGGQSNSGNCNCDWMVCGKAAV